MTIQGVSQSEAGAGDVLGPAGREIDAEDDGVSEDDEGMDKNVATGGGSDIIGGSNIRVDANGDVVMDQVNNAIDLEATLPEPLSAHEKESLASLPFPSSMFPGLSSSNDRSSGFFPP